MFLIEFGLFFSVFYFDNQQVTNETSFLSTKQQGSCTVSSFEIWIIENNNFLIYFVDLD